MEAKTELDDLTLEDGLVEIDRLQWQPIQSLNDLDSDSFYWIIDKKNQKACYAILAAKEEGVVSFYTAGQEPLQYLESGIERFIEDKDILASPCFDPLPSIIEDPNSEKAIELSKLLVTLSRLADDHPKFYSTDSKLTEIESFIDGDNCPDKIRNILEYTWQDISPWELYELYLNEEKKEAPTESPEITEEVFETAELEPIPEEPKYALCTEDAVLLENLITTLQGSSPPNITLKELGARYWDGISGEKRSELTEAIKHCDWLAPEEKCVLSRYVLLSLEPTPFTPDTQVSHLKIERPQVFSVVRQSMRDLTEKKHFWYTYNSVALVANSLNLNKFSYNSLMQIFNEIGDFSNENGEIFAIRFGVIPKNRSVIKEVSEETILRATALYYRTENGALPTRKELQKSVPFIKIDWNTYAPLLAYLVRPEESIVKKTNRQRKSAEIKNVTSNSEKPEKITTLKKSPLEDLLPPNAIVQELLSKSGHGDEWQIVKRQRETLNHNDLAFLINYACSEKASQLHKEWIGLICQRNWDGINSELREFLIQKVKDFEEVFAPTFTPWKTELLFALNSSLTPEELKVVDEWDKSDFKWMKEWSENLNKEDRESLIRIGKRKFESISSDDSNLVGFVDSASFIKFLGFAHPDFFKNWTRRNKISLPTFGIFSGSYTDEYLTLRSSEIRTVPHEVVLQKDLASHMGTTPESLVRWNTTNTISGNPHPLATLGIFTAYRSNTNGVEELRLIWARAASYERTGIDQLNEEELKLSTRFAQDHLK